MRRISVLAVAFGMLMGFALPAVADPRVGGCLDIPETEVLLGTPEEGAAFWAELIGADVDFWLEQMTGPQGQWDLDHFDFNGDGLLCFYYGTDNASDTGVASRGFGNATFFPFLDNNIP